MLYLKVSNEDVDFVNECCDKLMVLQQSESHMRDGLTFPELLSVLRSVGFFQGMELTDHEQVSVMSTQVLLDVLLASNIFGEAASKPKLRPKISRKVRDCNDIANDRGPFLDKRIYHNTRVVDYKF